MTPIFLSSNYDKPDKMQLFVKFKKIMWGGSRATLYFRKEMGFIELVFELLALKAKIKLFTNDWAVF